MTDTISILSSLLRKTAIRDNKLDFLAKRHAKRLEPLAVAAGLVILDGDTDEVKKQNETNLINKAKELIRHIAIADPTDAVNKNDYTDWLIRIWSELDDAHRARWAEDAPEIRGKLNDFTELKVRDEFKQKYSTDIMNPFYKDLQVLRDVVKEFNSATTRFPLPTLSEAAIQLYVDKSYILWQVTTPEDLVALSSFPPNNPPAWCTKGHSTAQNYLRTGPEYVAYKDGEPLFQIDPHDASGKPQFMSRHNTKMHSSRMMNGEAADLINRALISGSTNEQAKKDLDYVMSVYKAPNLNDAETFEYLSEYLMVNGSDARKDPRFLEIEQSYVKPRYQIMEADELRQLHNRYGRLGPATLSYMMDNKFVARLSEKISSMNSFTEFMAQKKSMTNAEFGLCFRLDGLFKLVYALFDKEFHIETLRKEFAAAVKQKDASTVLRKCSEITKLLTTHFSDARYGGDIQGFTSKTITEWGGERSVDCTPYDSVRGLVSAILGNAKPFIKLGLDAVISDVRDSEMGCKEAVAELQNRTLTIIDSLNGEAQREARNLVSNAIKEIGAAKLKLELASFTKVKDTKDKLKEIFAQEMQTYRGGDPRYSERNLPGWARGPVSEKMAELEALREAAQAEKAERLLNTPQREGVKPRFAPKREIEAWQSLKYREPLTPDPSERATAFLIESPSWDWREKIDMFLQYLTPTTAVDAWVLENASRINNWKLVQYVQKFKGNSWAALETSYPGILYEHSYVEMAYAGRRIPGKEPSLLAEVRANSYLANQIDYMEKHMPGQRWPELEARVITALENANWETGRWDEDPSRLAGGVIDYAKKIIKGRWKEIEPALSKSQDFLMRYIWAVIPDARERILRVLEDQETPAETKKSSLHKIMMASLAEVPASRLTSALLSSLKG